MTPQESNQPSESESEQPPACPKCGKPLVNVIHTADFGQTYSWRDGAYRVAGPEELDNLGLECFGCSTNVAGVASVFFSDHQAQAPEPKDAGVAHAPWTVDGEGHVSDAHGLVFAKVWGGTGMGEDVEVATGRLVAAAPDLIAALKDLVEKHDEDPPHLTAEEWDAARKAIAKAEGR